MAEPTKKRVSNPAVADEPSGRCSSTRMREKAGRIESIDIAPAAMAMAAKTRNFTAEPSPASIAYRMPVVAGFPAAALAALTTAVYPGSPASSSTFPLTGPLKVTLAVTPSGPVQEFRACGAGLGWAMGTGQ